jgi:hypothetical protein
MDGHDGIATVVFSAEETLEVEAMQRLLDFIELTGRLGQRVIVRLRGELEVHPRLVELGDLLAPRRDGLAQRRSFAQQRLRLLAVVPEIWSRGRVI